MKLRFRVHDPAVIDFFIYLDLVTASFIPEDMWPRKYKESQLQVLGR
jgi:hypothetical protein